jgi:hypothetical protein
MTFLAVDLLERNFEFLDGLQNGWLSEQRMHRQSVSLHVGSIPIVRRADTREKITGGVEETRVEDDVH